MADPPTDEYFRCPTCGSDKDVRRTDVSPSAIQILPALGRPMKLGCHRCGHRWTQPPRRQWERQQAAELARRLALLHTSADSRRRSHE